MTTDPRRTALAAAAFLRDHAREPVTLADVADAVGYSPFHLGRLFTATLGMSPIRYLALHRFHQAKHLLLTEGLNVVDVCHDVGFSSPGTFTRRFRDEVGVAPGDLRRIADEVAEGTPAPFRLLPPGAPSRPMVDGIVTPPPRLLGPDPMVWIGLFAQPAPAGIPGAGMLRRGAGTFALPVVPGYPWLLATVLPWDADPLWQLAAQAPYVAVHDAPVTGPTQVKLTFRVAHAWEPPILTALPALRKIGVSGRRRRS